MSNDKSAETTSEFRKLVKAIKDGKNINRVFKNKPKLVERYVHPTEIKLGRKLRKRYSTKQMKSIRRSAK